MGNYSSTNFDHLNDLQAVLEDTTSDIVQELLDVNNWPDTVLYFLKTLEVKAIELNPNQRSEFENPYRHIVAGLNSRLGEGGWE